jgi:hypothetical protein
MIYIKTSRFLAGFLLLYTTNNQPLFEEIKEKIKTGCLWHVFHKFTLKNQPF